MKKHQSLDQPRDTPEMREAIAWCRANKIDVRRHTDFQLKCGPINFWPGKKGTVHVDEIGTLPERGFEVFKSLAIKPHRSVKDVWSTCKELDLLPESSNSTIYL